MTAPTDQSRVTQELLRPIIGIDNRTALEVFDIMCDRIRGSRLAHASEMREMAARVALNNIADLGSCANVKTPIYKLFQQAIDIATGALS